MKRTKIILNDRFRLTLWSLNFKTHLNFITLDWFNFTQYSVECYQHFNFTEPRVRAGKSKIGSCVSLLNRLVQDQPDHGASLKPKIFAQGGFFCSRLPNHHYPNDLNLFIKET